MQIIRLESIDSDALLPFRTLRDRIVSKEGLFVADSIRVSQVILASGVRPVALLCTPEIWEAHKEAFLLHDIPTLYLAEKQVTEQIVGHRLHQHCMLLAKRPAPSPHNALGDRIVAMEALASTENLGAIARSAAAFGVDALLLGTEVPHPYTRRTVRVSTGHIAMLRYHIADDFIATIKALKSEGYTIVGAEATPRAQALKDFQAPGKTVLLIGHEEYGLSEEAMALCDAIVRIEMQEGVKSLNAAVAAGIVMHWVF